MYIVIYKKESPKEIPEFAKILVKRTGMTAEQGNSTMVITTENTTTEPISNAR